MTGLIGFLGFISFAYVLKLAGDIVSNGESHYRLKRLRVIEIDGDIIFKDELYPLMVILGFI